MPFFFPTFHQLGRVTRSEKLFDFHVKIVHFGSIWAKIKALLHGGEKVVSKTGLHFEARDTV